MSDLGACVSEQEKTEESEKACDDSKALQKEYQREAMNAQTEVNRQLVDVAKLQSVRSCWRLAQQLVHYPSDRIGFAF